MSIEAGPAPPDTTPEALLARLDELGLKTETRHHAPMFTVAEAKDLRGDIPGAHCKSLFLRDKKGMQWLVVTLEDQPIDLKALAGLIGAGRLSFASSRRLLACLGVAPGSVTPFALINRQNPGEDGGKLRVVLDADMMDAGLVNYHPLTNRATTTMSPADLLRFIDDCGHEPMIVKLPPASPASD